MAETVVRPTALFSLIPAWHGGELLRGQRLFSAGRGWCLLFQSYPRPSAPQCIRSDQWSMAETFLDAMEKAGCPANSRLLTQALEASEKAESADSAIRECRGRGILFLRRLAAFGTAFVDARAPIGPSTVAARYPIPPCIYYSLSLHSLPTCRHLLQISWNEYGRRTSKLTSSRSTSASSRSARHVLQRAWIVLL